MTNTTTNPAETTTNNKTPKLRFKGFAGEWRTQQIGSISETFSGGTPTVGVSSYYGGNIPFIRSAEINSSSTQLSLTEEGLANSSAKMVEKGSILYALYGATSGEVGIAKIKGAINQAVLNINPNKDFDAYFLMLWLRSQKKNIIGTFLQGGQGNLSGSIIKSLELLTPAKKEQQKIGSFFQQLDTNLTQHQTQLEKLKNLKQAMLHKMFPQNGATEPEIRFKGFSENWKAQNLEAITSPVSNNSLSRAKLNYKFGAAKNIHYGDILVRFDAVLDANRQDLPFITEQSDVDKLVGAALQVGDIVFADAAEDETVGKSVELVAASKQPVFAGLHTITFRPTYNFATGYLGYYTNSESYRKQLYPLMQGTKVLSLSRNSLKSTYISHPETLQEQQKIANYFRKLDQLITLQTTQLKKLQQIKQVCLTGMFV